MDIEQFTGLVEDAESMGRSEFSFSTKNARKVVNEIRALIDRARDRDRVRQRSLAWKNLARKFKAGYEAMHDVGQHNIGVINQLLAENDLLRADAPAAILGCIKRELELREENERLSALNACEHVDMTRGGNDPLAERAEKLADYAQHDTDCQNWADPNNKCDCGLGVILDGLHEEKHGDDQPYPSTKPVRNQPEEETKR